MAKLPTMDDMAKQLAERAKQEIIINGMTLREFIDNLENASANSECHLTTCKNNRDCHCAQGDMRTQCVYTALLILCLDGDKCGK